MQLTVLWFAHLRDQRALDSEIVASDAATPRELYRELALRHGLTLTEKSIVPAIDDAMARWDAPLADGCTVVFLPPVSGG